MPVVAIVSILLVGCARSPEAKKTRFLERGKQEMAKKDYSRAILEFQNAVRVGHKDPETYYQLALAYLASSDVRSAVALLRKATGLNPAHSAAQLKLAEIMAASSSKENVERAEAQAQKILSSLPGNADALDTLGVAEFRLGKPEDAERHFQEALARFPNRLQSAVNLAKVKLARRDLSGAEQTLKGVADQKPPSVEALVALGNFYRVIAKTTEAEQTFRQALRIDGRNGPALLGLAAVQSGKGKAEDAEGTLKMLSTLPDKSHALYGIYLFQTGKRDLALAEFARVAKEHPQDREARTRLVSAYVATNRISQANAVLSAALQKNSKDADALLQRASLSISSGNYSEAKKDLDQVIHFRRTSPEAHILLARLYAAQGAPLRERDELSEAVRLDPSQLGARLQLSRRLLASNGAKAALDLLKAAPAAQQKSLDYVVARNWALLAAGERTEARKNIDAALLQVHTPELLRQDAILKLDQKNHSGARASLAEALKQNPEDVAALQLLAASYRAQNQNGAAMAQIREYASKAPQSSRMQFVLGSSLAAAGDLNGARSAFSSAKAADPKFTASDIALAQLDTAENKLEDGRKRLAGVLTVEPKNIRAHEVLGELELKENNKPKAIEHYRKVVELAPGNVAALNNLAFLLAEFANKPNEALTYAQQAKEANPKNPGVDDTLGWVFYHKAMYPTAVKHLESAVAAEGTPIRMYHLAMAYGKNGDSKRARQLFEAAFRQSPNLAEAQKAKDVLGLK